MYIDKNINESKQMATNNNTSNIDRMIVIVQLYSFHLTDIWVESEQLENKETKTFAPK